MKTLRISFDTPKAWECWLIDITDDNAPEEITVEWLEANPDGWEYFDLVDRDAGTHENIVIDDDDVRGL